jgi:hypothetical protein
VRCLRADNSASTTRSAGHTQCRISFGPHRRNHTVSPSTNETSVVAISNVRSLNRQAKGHPRAPAAIPITDVGYRYEDSSPPCANPKYVSCQYHDFVFAGIPAAFICNKRSSCDQRSTFQM